MKKAGLAALSALGLVGACAACCAIPLVIPLAIPIIGTLSVSVLSLLAIDPFHAQSVEIAIAAVISLGAAVWAGAWYVHQRHQRLAMARNDAACSVPDSLGNGGCSKGVV